MMDVKQHLECQLERMGDIECEACGKLLTSTSRQFVFFCDEHCRVAGMAADRVAKLVHGRMVSTPSMNGKKVDVR